MKNMIYFIAVIFYLFGCGTTNNHMNIETDPTDSIETVIEKAGVAISNHLKKNGINPQGKRMIFKAYGQTHGENNEEPCEIFHNQEGYQGINEKVGIGSNWVTAMIIDENDNYIASSSPHTLIRNPDQSNDYLLELKMIELAQKNNYITYIRLFNCSENYIIGYKTGHVDVYRYENNEITLFYTK